MLTKYGKHCGTIVKESTTQYRCQRIYDSVARYYCQRIYNSYKYKPDYKYKEPLLKKLQLRILSNLKLIEGAIVKESTTQFHSAIVKEAINLCHCTIVKEATAQNPEYKPDYKVPLSKKKVSMYPCQRIHNSSIRYHCTIVKESTTQ
ncbi:hypothetical protein DPMN_150071 [Dreissena polymorpha]|uniref:Uncharacterized protein n=1 Tax=Dreissena polymorpha TaxID=45954 RepID=A0A9D4FIL9_DREPO|nr:hypothetical protein DPMN_150071 [Dreissena polymorpha]